MNPADRNGFDVVEAYVPAVELSRYITELRTGSQGLGTYSWRHEVLRSHTWQSRRAESGGVIFKTTLRWPTMFRTGGSSLHLRVSSRRTALAPPADVNYDIVSKALASEPPLHDVIGPPEVVLASLDRISLSGVLEGFE